MYEEEIAKIKAARDKRVPVPVDQLPEIIYQAKPVQPEMAPGVGSNHVDPKKAFRLKYKYLKKLQHAYLSGNMKALSEARVYHNNQVQAADAPKWNLNGKAVDRFKIMEYLIAAVSSGKLLGELCHGNGGFPTLNTVMQWTKLHPDFGSALEIAEEVQAQYFADEALGKIRNADRSEAGLVKVQHDALMKRASLQADKFKEKQIIRTEDITRKTEPELKAQLKALIEQYPELFSDELAASLGSPKHHDRPILAESIQDPEESIEKLAD